MKTKTFTIFVLLSVSIFGYSQNYQYIDSLKNRIEKANDTLKVELYLELTDEYQNFNYDSALIFAAKSFTQLSKINYEKGMGRYYFTIANLNKQRSFYDISLNNFHKALSIYKAIDYDVGICDALTGIGDIYEYQEKDSIALSYYYEALNTAKTLKFETLIAQNYNNIGAIIKYENPELAKDYFTKAINIYSDINDKKSLSACYNNLGILYLTQENFIDAEEILLIALDLKREVNNVHGQAITLNNLAYMSFERANLATDEVARIKYLKQAADYAEKSLKITEKTKSIYTRYNSYGTLTSVYYDLNMFEKAIEYQSSFMITKDSIFNIEQEKAIEEIEAKYQLSESRIKIETLEKDQNLAKARNLLIVTIILSFSLITVVVIVLLILKRKKDKLIFSQKEQIHQKEKALAEIELAQKQKKETELINEIDYKAKQLNTHALNMIQKNEILDEVKSDIKALHSEVIDKNKKGINKIINKINISQNSEKDWEIFRLYFEEINTDFYEKLKTINPELSVNDNRICALIKLNMNSPEIAQVLNIASNSIKSARYRLKKRLNLSQDDDLELFIRNL